MNPSVIIYKSSHICCRCTDPITAIFCHPYEAMISRKEIKKAKQSLLKASSMPFPLFLYHSLTWFSWQCSPVPTVSPKGLTLARPRSYIQQCMVKYHGYTLHQGNYSKNFQWDTITTPIYHDSCMTHPFLSNRLSPKQTKLTLIVGRSPFLYPW